jgi:uncharacterized membrane protein YeaQ/YmgE (transglycosylase-associated protein family)
MSMMWTVVIGLVVGVIARLIAPGRKGLFGFLLTSVLGVVGAFCAAYLGQEAGWFQADESVGLVSAVFGAVLVLLMWATLFRSRRASSSV